MSDPEHLELLGQVREGLSAPIALIQLAGLAARRQSAAHQAFRDEVVGELVHGEAADEFELFVAILGTVQRELFSWSDTQTWSNGRTLYVSWAHASRLFCIFRNAGVPPLHAAQWFSGRSQLLAHLDSFLPPEVTEDLAFVRWVDRPAFLVRSLAWVAQATALPFEQAVVDTCRELAFLQDFEGLPVPGLLKSPTLSENGLGVPWACAEEAPLVSLLGEPGAGISELGLQETIAQLLELLEADLSDLTGWHLLYWILGPGIAAHETVNRLERLIQRVAEGGLANANFVVQFRALAVASDCRDLLDPNDTEAVVARLLELVETCRDGDASLGMQREDAVLSILSFAGMLCINDSARGVQRLVRFLEQLLGAIPAAASWLGALNLWPYSVPAEHLRGSWTASLLVRVHRDSPEALE